MGFRERLLRRRAGLQNWLAGDGVAGRWGVVDFDEVSEINNGVRTVRGLLCCARNDGLNNGVPTIRGLLRRQSRLAMTVC